MSEPQEPTTPPDEPTEAPPDEAMTALLRRVLELEVADVTRGVLADPSDLLLNVDSADLVGEDGLADRAKIATAAANLIATKAHLKAPVKPKGDIDQGARQDVARVGGMGDVLRAAQG